jgi:hypothetical protein
MRMQVLKFLLISDSSEYFQHYDFYNSTIINSTNQKIEISFTILYFVPFSRESFKLFTKSLILAQDERWRRG